MEGYKGGRITRIKLKGFMTYDEIDLKPKKGLNLIVGLNGSGKSSIMSAICLGLGGKPQFTGRSFQTSDFINFKHKEAEIEIELESFRGKNDVIRRVIQPDKSIWYLNGSHAQQSEIAAVVKKYNIDIGNLCQFLPQEKVAEFSKMDKKQRLENMIKAIGEPSLYTMFGDLKDMRKEYCHVEKELEILESSRNSEVKMNEVLRPELEKQEERFRLQAELAALRVQKMIAQYNILQGESLKIKEEKKSLKRDMLRIEKELASLSSKKESLFSESNGLRHEIKEKSQRIAYLTGELSKQLDNFNMLHEQVDNAKITFRNKITKKEEQKAELIELNSKIKGFQEALKKKEHSVTEMKAQISKNAEQYEAIENEISSLDYTMGSTNLEINRMEFLKKRTLEEVERISSEENKKFEILKRSYPDTYKAVCWLQEHQNSFRAPISMPALISIQVTDDENRKFLENAISKRDLLMFVCEDKQDLERFMNVMKKDKKLSVNVTMVPDENINDFSSPAITGHMRKLGMQCFLKDLFIAPESVMRFLCKLSRLHQVPVCNNNAESNVEHILKYNSLFFTPTERITGKRSQYGNRNLSVKRDFIVDRKILPNIKDNSEILNNLEMKLKNTENSLNELNSKFMQCSVHRTELDKKLEALRKVKHELEHESLKISEIQFQIKQLTETYIKKKAAVIDEEQEKAYVKEKICSANSTKKEILAMMHKLIKEFLLCKKEKLKRILVLKFFSENISSLESEIKTKEKAQSDTEKCLLEKTVESTALKTQGFKLYDEIKKLDLDKLKPAQQGPEVLEQVEQSIANIEARLEFNNENIAPILAEYKERQEKILNAEEHIKEYETRMKTLQAKIEEKKKHWLQRLINHIDNINKKFSEYYKFLQCAGEISLDTADDSDDFPNYGLQIKLKYRVDEDFMELSQTHHSGGECSVAAIIFILSLQELTEVPFRCIDEINQGMDAVNERKMYQLVADAAKSGSCSQYFLLTPKLLMDLSYHKDVAVHIIYNSIFLQTKLDVERHLEIAKTCKS
ncbi:structural maintenance of chromosomes protein 5 [Trichonephila clavata]|uniref:Structural maintenance of chromosomes protein 5 n=1 Tax=Trichonephila clavata TaxID=2740835 RepID=A0A8X6LCN0_TRICU|nr:structural maintenance of chromosomes protein 5 [Trichonephila clavata]